MGYQFAYIELFQKENADLPSRITRKPEYFPSHKLYRSIFSFIVVETWIFAIYSWTTKQILSFLVWHKGHSTLNVEPKYLTSPIFLKFCGQLPLAKQWWHAKFENDRITFRALFGHFAGAAQKVPKEGLKLPQFSNRSNFLNNYGTANFYILKSRFNYFLSF